MDSVHICDIKAFGHHKQGETGALHHLVVMQAPNQKEHFEIFMEQEKLEAY